MVTKKKSTATKNRRLKLKNLALSKETVKNLSGTEKKQIKGGAIARTNNVMTCLCSKN
jgi:hypothetical protein